MNGRYEFSLADDQGHRGYKNCQPHTGPATQCEQIPFQRIHLHLGHRTTGNDQLLAGGWGGGIAVKK